MLNYGVSDAVVNGVATPFTTQTAKPSLCKVDGMYGGDINGTTSTVGFEAMTALKRDGSASIPAPLVPELKGTFLTSLRGKSVENQSKTRQMAREFD